MNVTGWWVALNGSLVLFIEEGTIYLTNMENVKYLKKCSLSQQLVLERKTQQHSDKNKTREKKRSKKWKTKQKKSNNKKQKEQKKHHSDRWRVALLHRSQCERNRMQGFLQKLSSKDIYSTFQYMETYFDLNTITSYNFVLLYNIILH